MIFEDMRYVTMLLLPHEVETKMTSLLSNIVPDARKSMMNCHLKYNILASTALTLRFMVGRTMSFDNRQT